MEERLLFLKFLQLKIINMKFCGELLQYSVNATSHHTDWKVSPVFVQHPNVGHFECLLNELLN